jgi:hypothetical protein
LGDGQLVVSNNLNIRVNGAYQLIEVIGKAVIVVD